jgi:myo-inositol-1(or 4)-monophosphatase
MPSEPGISDAEAERRASVAERAARAGATVAERSFRGGLPIEKKNGKTDVVTQADRDAQTRVVEVIQEAYPDDAIVGEEADELKESPG